MNRQLAPLVAIAVLLGTASFASAEAPEKGRLVGRVVTGTPAKPVAGAQVWGIYRHPRGGLDLKAKTDKDGNFTVERKLCKTVLYARSADNRLAGIVEITAGAPTVTIPIHPVGSARGRLVDPDRKPLGGREILFGVRVPMGDDPKNDPFRTAFGGSVKTDSDGRFLLSGLVVGQLVHIDVTVEPGKSWRTAGQVRPKDARPTDLGNLTLASRYRPPTLEERITTAFQSKQSPRERFTAAVRDARLSRQHVLLVFAAPDSAGAKQFFRLRFEDDEVRDALDPYRIVPIPLGEKALPAAQELAKHLNVNLEKRALPLLVVYDTEEVQIALAEAGRSDRATLMRFLKSHPPKTLDARKLLADALAQAKKEKKRVLVQETATWCPPCWALSRFLDRHRDLWSKDYLWVKIDHRWTHAGEVMKEIRKGAQGGIPWTAILGADGKVLVTSNDPEGNNIGFPSTQPGIEHFAAMLRKTSIRLTEGEIAKLLKALQGR
jgi:hypothetical protein